MEFFQFHPTGIVGIGILLSEAARGEGGILRNHAGERFMERYAPTLLDLAPRDMVSRAIYMEIREGRGIGLARTTSTLDLTHLGKKVIDEKLPDITEFARVYQGIEPITQPVPIQPTAHYAHGRHPDRRRVARRRRREEHGPARAVRGRGVRLRVRPWRESAGHELAHRHPGVRSARRSFDGAGPARGARDCPTLPADAAEPVARRDRGHARRGRGARTPHTSGSSWRDLMMDNCGVFRTRRGAASS